MNEYTEIIVLKNGMRLEKEYLILHRRISWQYYITFKSRLNNHKYIILCGCEKV